MHTGQTAFAPPTWKLLRVEHVKMAAHNPGKRVEKRRLKDLLRSMSEVGLLYEILVDEDYQVIDGHRRLACARELGWETIPAKVIKGNRDVLYASVNVTATKMSGNENLAVWLVQPQAVSPRMQKLFVQMKEVLGESLIRELCERGLSARVYQTALRLSRYCGQQTPVFVQKAVRWLMDVAVIGQVMKAMEAGTSPAQLAGAIRRMKPLRFLAGIEN